jgi:hypothetical protein
MTKADTPDTTGSSLAGAPIYRNQIHLVTPNDWMATRPEDWALPARRMIFTLAGDERMRLSLGVAER